MLPGLSILILANLNDVTFLVDLARDGYLIMGGSVANADPHVPGTFVD